MRDISIRVGPPVEGTDFYGREKELQYAWEYHVSKGVSLLLSAPRRVGKTSFSKELIKRAEGKGWKTLYLDLEGITTASEFVKLFKKEFNPAGWFGKTVDIAANLLKDINEFNVAGNKISINFKAWRSETYGNIRLLIENSENVLIVIDELSIYLNHLLKQEESRDNVEFFLEWLRNFRQTTKVCWIFCSSVSIENFASMHQLNKHLNDLHLFSIGAFSEDEAKDFILRLNVDEKVQFTDAYIQYILKKLDWYLPFFIQILVNKINFLVCIMGKQFTEASIDEAYNLLITENHFSTWDERLKVYDEFEDNARKILKLCVFPNGRSRNDLLIIFSTKKSEKEKAELMLSKLLEMLQKDGYLAEHNGKYKFRSPLLRDFWYDRYIK